MDLKRETRVRSVVCILSSSKKRKKRKEKNSERRFSLEETERTNIALDISTISRLTVVTHSVEEAPPPPMLSNPRPAADFGSEASETGRCISHNNRAPGFEFGYVDARRPIRSHLLPPPHPRHCLRIECARAHTYNHEKLRLDFIWAWATTPHLLPLLFSSSLCDKGRRIKGFF